MRTLIIVPEANLCRELSQEALRVPDLHIARVLEAFPDLDELLRTIRIQKPDFLIVSVENFPKIEPVLASIVDMLPAMPIIGIAHQVDHEMGRKLMRLGIRDYLESPVCGDKLIEVIDFVKGQLTKHPLPMSRPADLYSFLPAKAGVGTSTIALASSCALAEDLAVRTLLLDCDLAAGIVNFHLKLGNSASIIDAIAHAENLDEDMWRQMVGRWDKLEVLHAGNLSAPSHIPPAGLQRVLALARAQYDVICADLGSDLDEFAIELLRESQRIFLVTTPEVAPVHLAQMRVRRLNDLGLGDRVSLILNRKDGYRSHLQPDAVTKAVGIPIAYTIGNDYQACSDALLHGSSVPNESEIGRSILSLAQSLRTDPSQKALTEAHGCKFLEFFHVARTEDPATIWRN